MRWLSYKTSRRESFFLQLSCFITTKCTNNQPTWWWYFEIHGLENKLHFEVWVWKLSPMFGQLYWFSKRKTPRYVLRLSQVHWNKSVPVAPLIAFKCLIWACGKPDFVSRTFHFRYSYFAQITKSYKWAFFLTAQDFGVWVSCMEESAECKSSNGIFYEYVIGLVPGMHDFLYKILLSNPKRLCCLFLRGCLLFVLLHIQPKTWLGIKVQHFFSWSGQLMLYSDHILVGLKLENWWCASLKLKIN